MLNAPQHPVFARCVAVSCRLEDVGVLLAVAQVHRHLTGAYLGKCAAEEQRPADVGQGAVKIGIEVDGVAQAEVGQEVFALVGHAEGDGVVTIVGRRLFFVGNAQAGVDVARLLFLRDGHVPEVGCRIAGAFYHTQPAGQLLAVDKVGHVAEIAVGDRVHVVQGHGDSAQLRIEPVVPKVLVDGLGAQCERLQPLNERGETSLTCHADLLRHYLVAQVNGLVDEFAVVGGSGQPRGHAISGVEQASVDAVVGQREIAAQTLIVEQQLHIVGLGEHGPVRHGVAAVDGEVLARFLLDQQPQVGRHEVDASLKAHLLAHETRLKDGLAPVVGRLEEHVDRLADVSCLELSFLVERLAFVEVLAGAVFECLLAEIVLEGLAPVVVVAPVDDVVERTSCEVSDEDGL